MPKLTVDRVAGSVLAIFSLVVLWECRGIPFGTLAEPGPGAVPVLLALILLVCSIAVVAGGAGGPRIGAVGFPEWRHGAAILAACIFIALAIERLGYVLSIVLALFFLVRVMERKSWLASLVFAGGFALGTHLLFDALLRVPLPRGPFDF